jgi:hypothetical protein
MKEIVSSFIICYAIGYMLYARPYLMKKNWAKATDPVFYISLVGLSVYRYLS